MRLLNSSKTVEWIEKKAAAVGYPDCLETTEHNKLPEVFYLRIRTAKYELSRLFLNDPTSELEILLSIEEAGVFENTEREGLFTRLRQPHAGPMDVYEYPGTVFTGVERELCFDLCIAAMLNSWDLLLVSNSGPEFFFADHDDRYFIRANGDLRQEK